MAIPLHKRRKIADFDPVRDGKTVTQFCKELGISRQTYHNIKNRIAQKGRAGIVPDSTAPKNPVKKFDEADKIAVVHARQQLMEQGLDYGPWSIYYFLFDTPSPNLAPAESTNLLHSIPISRKIESRTTQCISKGMPKHVQNVVPTMRGDLPIGLDLKQVQ